MIVGGAQENTLFNCLDLVRIYQDDVLLVTGRETGPEGDLLSRGRAGELNVKYLTNLQRAIHPVHDVKASRGLREIIRDFKPDVVHTHSAKGGLLGRYAAHAENVPVVVHTVHGAPFHPYQSAAARTFFQVCERWAAKRCHHLISVADAMTDLMVDAKVASRQKFTTIHSGMDVEPFLAADAHRSEARAQFGFQDHEIVIGKIARLFHLKGHDDLVTAAVPVIRQHPNVRFLLVGDGILRQSLTSRIESLGISNHFVFAGLVDPSEVPRMIGAMDALVHTSYREGLARALPQALIAGKPVVSYDCDGAREVVLPGITGFLPKTGDTAELAQSLVRLAENEELRREMGRAGRSRFTDIFRHETMTARIRELYENLLSR
jgi:glycosyltransferase involved in cell wall biosynthesis